MNHKHMQLSRWFGKNRFQSFGSLYENDSRVLSSNLSWSYRNCSIMATLFDQNWLQKLNKNESWRVLLWIAWRASGWICVYFSCIFYIYFTSHYVRSWIFSTKKAIFWKYWASFQIKFEPLRQQRIILRIFEVQF